MEKTELQRYIEECEGIPDFDRIDMTPMEANTEIRWIRENQQYVWEQYGVQKYFDRLQQLRNILWGRKM